MNDTVRRVTAYGLFAGIASSLCYGGWVYKTDPDAGTLLSSAQVYVQLARSIPVLDKEGTPVAARVKLLRDAADAVNRARQQFPDLYAVNEMDAFVRAERGDYVGAATMYARAQSSDGATAETVVIDILNEVRMWRAAKRPQYALDVLNRHTAALKPSQSASQIERVMCLIDLARDDEATALAESVAKSSKDSVSLMEAGLYLDSKGKAKGAHMAFERAVSGDPMANYFLARLKMRDREYDRSLSYLRHAVTADGQRVRTLCERDRKIWLPLAEDEHFKELFMSADKASPGR